MFNFFLRQRLDSANAKVKKYESLLRNLKNFRYIAYTDFQTTEKKKSLYIKKIHKYQLKADRLAERYFGFEWLKL